VTSDNNRPDELCDLENVNIPKELTPDEKKKEYLRQTGSSTMHKVGDITVTCSYGDMDLDKMLDDITSK
jgi:hypothetical protein